MREARLQHNETSPELTGGDVDASWEDAYSTGDEAPGGDNPTPDQDRVDDIGKALGVTYEDSEELKAADKIVERDRHRWELDPASAEDYPEHEIREGLGLTREITSRSGLPSCVARLSAPTFTLAPL